jgi:hypothetical protein
MSLVRLFDVLLFPSQIANMYVCMYVHMSTITLLYVFGQFWKVSIYQEYDVHAYCHTRNFNKIYWVVCMADYVRKRHMLCQP